MNDTQNRALGEQKFLIQLDFSLSVLIIHIPFDSTVATGVGEGGKRFAVCFQFRLWCHLFIQVQVLCKWQGWSKGTQFIPSSFQASWTKLCPEADSPLAVFQVSATSVCEALFWLLCILHCFCSALLNPTPHTHHHLLLRKMGKSFQTRVSPLICMCPVQVDDSCLLVPLKNFIGLLVTFIMEKGYYCVYWLQKVSWSVDGTILGQITAVHIWSLN